MPQPSEPTTQDHTKDSQKVTYRSLCRKVPLPFSWFMGLRGGVANAVQCIRTNRQDGGREITRARFLSGKEIKIATSIALCCSYAVIPNSFINPLSKKVPPAVACQCL